MWHYDAGLGSKWAAWKRSALTLDCVDAIFWGQNFDEEPNGAGFSEDASAGTGEGCCWDGVTLVTGKLLFTALILTVLFQPACR